jgi:hypothetical protein
VEHISIKGKQLKPNGDIQMSEKVIGKVSDFFAQPAGPIDREAGSNSYPWPEEQ